MVAFSQYLAIFLQKSNILPQKYPLKSKISLALKLNLFVLVKTTSVPNLMLSSKFEQFVQIFAISRWTKTICVRKNYLFSFEFVREFNHFLKVDIVLQTLYLL